MYDIFKIKKQTSRHILLIFKTLHIHLSPNSDAIRDKDIGYNGSDNGVLTTGTKPFTESSWLEILAWVLVQFHGKCASYADKDDHIELIFEKILCIIQRRWLND